MSVSTAACVIDVASSVLDALMDYRVTESGSLQINMFRGGAGVYDTQDSSLPFHATELPKWALTEDNIMAWWAMKELDDYYLSTTADADGICQAQTPADGGLRPMTINGTLASGATVTLTIPQRITVTSVADESERVFTIAGTDRYGASLVEEIAGGNAATVKGVRHFLTITAVYIDHNSTGAITVGVLGRTACTTAADALGAKLIANTDDSTPGLWNQIKKRPVHAVGAALVLEMATATSTITIRGVIDNIFIAGRTFQVSENTTTANNRNYTVVSAFPSLPTVTAIVAGRYYVVADGGSIFYNSVTYTSTANNPAIFLGVSGKTTFSGTGDVALYATNIVVSETISADMAFATAGNGVVLFHDYGASVDASALYAPFAVEYGETTRAKDSIDYLERFETADRTFGYFSGYRSYLRRVQDLFIADGEYRYPLTASSADDGYIFPWSSNTFYGSTASVSFSSSWLAALAYASIDDYGKTNSILKELLKGRSLADNGYPHTTEENLDFHYNFANYYALINPKTYPMLQEWAGCEDTALGVIAQKPNGFWGIESSGLVITGRSSKNEIRGMVKMGDYFYAVCGNILVRIDSSGNQSLISTTVLITDSGAVTMANDGVNLFICDGTDSIGYHYSSSTGIFTHINAEDHDFLGGGSVTFINGYFISNAVESNEYFVWLPGEFADITERPSEYAVEYLKWDTTQMTAEAKPGNIVSVYADSGQLIVFKAYSMEIFYNDANDTEAPFHRYEGGYMETGCGAIHSVASLDNSVYWLAADKTIRRLDGFRGVIVSTPQMSYQMETYSYIGDARAFGYTMGGKMFYQINFPTADESWIYEVSTRLWSKRESYKIDLYGNGRHRANCYLQFNGKHYVGDFENGAIYRLDDAVYSDDGHSMRWKRTCPILTTNNTMNTYSRLEIWFEPGVGLLAGQGRDPKVMLRLSKDGGYTWGNELWGSLGKMGEYGIRTVWNNLGAARKLVAEVSGSDPVKIVIIEAMIEGDPGEY